MLLKKLLLVSTLVILSCGYSQVASACENKFTSSAFGSLEKEDLDELKQKYRNTSMEITRSDTLSLWDVKSILGFSGEKTKSASNGRVQYWIWVDRDNCKRKIKASFSDQKLVKIKSYGF